MPNFFAAASDMYAITYRAPGSGYNISQLSWKHSHAGSQEFEFNVSQLEPGTHLFILAAEDGFGNSIMKVFPFKTGQGKLLAASWKHWLVRVTHSSFSSSILARRKCCPAILSNSSATTSPHQPLAVDLQLIPAPGNCSLAEGFR